MLNLITKAAKLFALLFVTCNFLLATCDLFSQQPTQEWVARYHSPHTEQDRFMSMALDKSGNSYVTGWSVDSINGNDIVTAKINPFGQIVWSNVYTSGGSASVDIGEAIAVDDSGNVFVTGYTGSNFGPYNIIILKYDSNGNTRWTRIYNSESAAYDVKLDRIGNVYITGTSMSRATTIKYNTYGDSIWVRKYLVGLGSESYNLSIDGSGKISVAGSIHLANYWVTLIMKYDTTGNLLWANSYDNGGASAPSGISVDSLGNGAVAGVISLPSYPHSDYYTVRFTASGNTLWQKYYNAGIFNDYASSVAVDNYGNTYVTGSSWGSNSQDYATIKYNSLGDSVWVRRYNGPGNSYDNAYSICLDTLLNCYVTGASIGSGTGDDFATIKYDASGNQIWLMRYNGPSNGGDGAGSVIVGTNSTVYVGGESDGNGTNKDLIVVKYDQIMGIVNNTNELPVKYKLYQNYPNPFNSTTVISYELPKRSYVRLTLYNSLGQLVKQMVNADRESGYYHEVINSDNFSSGVYFYKISAGNSYFETKKLIIVK